MRPPGPPIAGRVGRSLDEIAWKRLGPGLWHYPISLSPGASGDLRLIKVAPGKELPEHGHRGEELTLLLRGSYHDEIGTFQEGDIADLDDEVEHRPVADEMTGCICLIASEKKARFKGLIARLLQPFIGV
jgi:putative transcriptional regulator